MERFLQDFRYAARTLASRPAFTSVVVLTLALGIGANTAIFSFVNALLLTPLPYKEADRLVRIVSQRGPESGKVSLMEVEDFKEQAQLFEGFASFRNTQYTVTGEGEPEAVVASINTYNLFELLGVEPFIGSTWPPEHDRARVFAVVIGHGLWKRRFGGDPNIVGKTIILDAASYTVLGVMPPNFNFPVKADIYRRTPPGDYENRGIREASVVARLKPGVTIEQAQSDIDSITRRLGQTFPDTNSGVRFTVIPLREYWTGNARPYLMLLLGAVGFVLLIACANVINLLLSRGLAREKEFAIRIALGAGRNRLIRQLLTESLLLTLLGGAIGLALSAWCVELLANLIRIELPLWLSVRLDLKVLAFTFVVSVVIGILAGLVPALQAVSPDLHKTLKESGRGSSAGTRQQSIRRLLVIAEVALALPLLVGAGLMMRSFVRLQKIDAGFDPSNLLTLKIDPPWSKFNKVEQTAPFYKRVIEEIKALPGVESVGANDGLPLADQDAREGANKQTPFIEGRSVGDQERNPYVNTQMVSPDYFHAMRIPLLAGRSFNDHDVQGATFVGVISQRMAETFWPGQDPLGRRLRLGKRSQNYRPVASGKADDEPWLTIVGVVGNVKQGGVTSDPGMDVYICDQQFFVPETHLVVRTGTDPLAFTGAVKSAVWKVDPDQAVFDILPMNERVSNMIWQQRLSGIIFALFAGLALALAAIGIYGVISYSVAQRTHEIGIRMALGAGSKDVLMLVVRQGMKIVVIGISVGIAASLVMARIMGSLLYEVSAGDPATYFGVSLTLAAVALLACYIPARKAARVNPLIALRND